MSSLRSTSLKNVRHVLSVGDFNKQFLEDIFQRAALHKNIAKSSGLSSFSIENKRILNLFFEPSTRTMESFTLAGQRLGADVNTTVNARKYSSYAKSESDADAVRTYAAIGYDTLVVRHDTPGGPRTMAEVSPIPIINAGDGNNEHPTQALLDLYTILDEQSQDVSSLKNKVIVFGGDVKNGRTIRSLATLLARHYPTNKLVFATHPELAMDDDLRSLLAKTGVEFTETTKAKEVLSDADVIYWTRTQLERGSAENTLSHEYQLQSADLKSLKPTATIMHPLPRVKELQVEPEDDRRVAIFRQVQNGVFVRMALLEWVNKVI